jgi:hypothetical protein
MADPRRHDKTINSKKPMKKYYKRDQGRKDATAGTTMEEVEEAFYS